MKAIFIILPLLVVSTAEAQSAAPSECFVSKYESFAEAQDQWQRGLALLISEATPSYSDVALLFMNDQLNAIERNVLAVRYLAENEPEKLRSDQPVNNWLDLDEPTKERIINASDRYGELDRLRGEAMIRPPHPDADAVRELMREELMVQPPYQALLATFTGSVERVNEVRCPRVEAIP